MIAYLIYLSACLMSYSFIIAYSFDFIFYLTKLLSCHLIATSFLTIHSIFLACLLIELELLSSMTFNLIIPLI